MAVFRKISISFWSDSFVQGLTPEGKYFYLYLMSNTKTTQCGIYEITLNQMCFDTGYNSDTVSKLIDQFAKSGKIIHSKETNEIALKNWPKYNASDSPKVLSCIRKELSGVKNKDLIQYLYSMDTEPQKEEEEEKEEEKEKEEVDSDFTNDLKISFEEFWNRYDMKFDKPKCEKKWKKISKKAREKIMQTLGDYIASTPDKQWRKRPYSYLNAEAWNNEIILPSKNNGKNDKPYKHHLTEYKEDFGSLRSETNSNYNPDFGQL